VIVRESITCVFSVFIVWENSFLVLIVLFNSQFHPYKINFIFIVSYISQLGLFV
jgi:hypothetical protein